MALTVQTAIDRVMSRLNEGGTPVVLPPDIQPLITDSLEQTAEVVSGSSSPQVRQLLRKDFSIAVASGVGSFATAFADPEPPLRRALPTAYLVTAAGDVMQNLPDRTQLSLARPLGFFVYWILDGVILRTRNKDGSLTSLSTTVTATVTFVPLITSIDGQEIEEIFLSVLERLIKNRLSIVEPPKVQEAA